MVSSCKTLIQYHNQDIDIGTHHCLKIQPKDGSKMASASRVVQVVKPHTPLIRFPDKRDNPKPNFSEVLRSAGLPSYSSSISRHSKGSKSPDLLMHQGPPDTAEIIKTLPQKYRRKLVSQEETEFIQRGGPE
ncbi:PREDICTED: 28S ribosomal protein S36, mitochondrial-like [Odobenus rosmarus divergens]|uniref:28S ribosomal protein S36, mitochondrial-like n=1 Tax=Odobenus rosmarus divergens TaxID=9708 RepID=A0A9B0H367_ODORO